MDAVDMKQALLVGRLSGDDATTAFRRFVQLARRLSSSHPVRGALLFDGDTVVHLLEGASAALCAFISALHGADTPVAMQVVASRHGDAMLLPPGWRVGYVEPLALEGDG